MRTRSTYLTATREAHPRRAGGHPHQAGSGTIPRSWASRCASVGSCPSSRPAPARAPGRRGVGRPVAGLGGEHALPAAGRLRQPEDQVRQEEGGKGEDDEGGAPGQRGDVAGDGEADARPGQFPGQDVAVDLASLRPRDPVADQRRHRGRRGGGHRPEPDPVEAAAAWNEDAVAPQIIATPQITIAMPRIQVRRARSASTPNGTENTAPTSDVTATSRPMSVLPMCSACRSSIGRGPDRGRVRARQGQHAAEHEHDPGARRAAGRRDDAAASLPARRGGQPGRRTRTPPAVCPALPCSAMILVLPGRS